MMKFTVRMKRAILQGFIFNVVVFLIFIAIGLFHILPKYLEIQRTSQELATTVHDINTVKISGINFAKFKSIAAGEDISDPYISTVITESGKEFYDSIILNSDQKDFETHIENLSEEMRDFKNSNEYISREKSLSTVLPVYIPGDSQGLKDVDFINYIERLLYTFSLSKTGDIGIGNIVNIEEGDADTSKNQIISESKLEEGIYYIPLSFEIVGQKKDIFDFIHYFENVGSISYDNDRISIHNDDILRKNIHGSEDSINIYESQIADISSISMTEYPDSSTFSSIGENRDLFNLISGSQGRERFEVDIELRFYVSGLPAYSMEEFINETIVFGENLAQNITKDFTTFRKKENILTLGSQIQALEELKNLDIFMSSFGEEIGKFKIEFLKKADISGTYSQAIVLEKQLKLIDLKYKEALKNLELSK